MTINPLVSLIDFLSIPSVSTQPEYAADMSHAALYLADLLTSFGFSTQLLPATKYPAVFASLVSNSKNPTLLIYGHYDVQPPGGLSLWTTPPFTPAIRKGRIYARGATDNKGQLMVHIMAAARLVEKYGKNLPVNIKFVIEGEEEIGSPSVESLAKKYSDLLKADYILVSDTEMQSPNHPSIDISLRGVMDIEVRIQTSNHDLHSGQFGGVAPNPAFILADLLSKLKNGRGKVLLPDFYSDIIPPTVEEKSDFAKLEPNAKQIMDEGKFYFIGGGEKHLTLNQRRWTEPTLDITGMDAGYTGQGTKTIIPSDATAKISIRLIPGQNPQKIYYSFINFLQSNCHKNCVISVFLYPVALPYKAPTADPIFKLVKRVLHSTFGHPAVYTGQGGSIGFVPVLAASLRVPCVLIGFGLADENLHAPNEHFSLSNYFKGIQAMTNLYQQLPKLTLTRKFRRHHHHHPKILYNYAQSGTVSSVG